MKLTLKEMNGLLNGKCLPSDLIVGETLAEYLVRKFTELEQKLAESQREFRAADATIENLQMQVEKLAAENAGLKAANAEGCKWDGEQWVGISIQTPATDAFLAEVRASAVDEVCLKISNAIINCHQDEMVGLDEAATICGDFAAQLRKGVQS